MYKKYISFINHSHFKIPILLCVDFFFLLESTLCRLEMKKKKVLKTQIYDENVISPKFIISFLHGFWY